MVTILKKLRLPGSRDVVEDEVVEGVGSWDDDEEVVEYAAPDSLSSSVEHKRFRALPKRLSKQKFLCCPIVLYLRLRNPLNGFAIRLSV